MHNKILRSACPHLRSSLFGDTVAVYLWCLLDTSENLCRADSRMSCHGVIWGSRLQQQEQEIQSQSICGSNLTIQFARVSPLVRIVPPNMITSDLLPFCTQVFLGKCKTKEITLKSRRCASVCRSTGYQKQCFLFTKLVEGCLSSDPKMYTQNNFVENLNFSFLKARILSLPTPKSLLWILLSL